MAIRSFLHIALAYINQEIIFILARNLNEIRLMKVTLSYEHNGIAQKHKKLEKMASGFTGEAEVAITLYEEVSVNEWLT